MKSIGIVRQVDELGRIVIPKETRQMLAIDIKDSLAIYTDEDTIILKKYQPGCILCDNVNDLVNYKNRNICRECLAELAEKL